MKLNWIIYSFLTMIIISIFNILQVLPNKNIKKDINLQMLYMRIILIIAGIISCISFLIPGMKIDDIIIKKAIDLFDIKLILGSSICLFIFNILLLFSFSQGGLLAGVIINLNLIFSILFSVLVLKTKINFSIWIGLLLYTLSGIYVIYEKNKIS